MLLQYFQTPILGCFYNCLCLCSVVNAECYVWWWPDWLTDSVNAECYVWWWPDWLTGSVSAECYVWWWPDWLTDSVSAVCYVCAAGLLAIRWRAKVCVQYRYLEGTDRLERSYERTVPGEGQTVKVWALWCTNWPNEMLKTVFPYGLRSIHFSAVRQWRLTSAPPATKHCPQLTPPWLTSVWPVSRNFRTWPQQP